MPEEKAHTRRLIHTCIPGQGHLEHYTYLIEPHQSKFRFGNIRSYLARRCRRSRKFTWSDLHLDDHFRTRLLWIVNRGFQRNLLDFDPPSRRTAECLIAWLPGEDFVPSDGSFLDVGWCVSRDVCDLLFSNWYCENLRSFFCPVPRKSCHIDCNSCDINVHAELPDSSSLKEPRCILMFPERGASSMFGELKKPADQ
jgi:hypothetical protein